MALKFPLDLDQSNYPFILFTPYEWITDGKRTQTPVIKKNSQPPERSIALPLPTNGLMESFDYNWVEADDLQIGTGASAELKFLKNQLQAQVGEIFQYTQYQVGKMMNDFASLAYGGVGFRDFTFEFSMIPNNESEAQAISDIILEFKRNSLPDYTNSFIAYPNFYTINTFFPQIDVSLIKFKDLVITNLTCNYFPDSLVTIFRTGQPIKIDLSITVKELDKQRRGDY